jgi:hypothetical protein
MRKYLTPVIATLLILGFAAPAAASPNVAVITPPPPPATPTTTRAAPTTGCRPYQRCQPYRRYRRARRYRRTYRRYRRVKRHRKTYRPYRRYRRTRRYRRYRTGRLPYRYRKPYHRKGGLYFGIGTGYLGFIRPTGAFKHMDSQVYFTPYFGWNFNPIIALELGYNGTILKERGDRLGNIKSPGLFNVSLDLKVRLLKPSRLRYVVPYLQAGLGISFMTGTVKADSECDKDKSIKMAHGGTISVGGGLDIYLKKWVTIGLRGLYRPLFLSGTRCGPGASARCGVSSQPFQTQHAWSAELNFTFVMPG